MQSPSTLRPYRIATQAVGTQTILRTMDASAGPPWAYNEAYEHKHAGAGTSDNLIVVSGLNGLCLRVLNQATRPYCVLIRRMWFVGI